MSAARPNNPWYLPDDVTPGQPRRHIAQEFYTNVISLGEYARARYLDECRAGARAFDQAEIEAFDRDLDVCRKALEQFT